MKIIKKEKYETCLLAIAVFLLVVSGCMSETERDWLHALMDNAEDFQNRENPFRGGEDGKYLENDRLWSESIEDLERQHEFWVEIKERLDANVDRESLELHDQITFDSFDRWLTNKVRNYEYQSYMIPINHEGGFFNRLIGLENQISLDSIQDYEDYMSRLRAIPEFFDQHVERMSKGIEIGYTLPKVIFVEDYNHYITTHIRENPKESGFYEPFKDLPEDFSEEDRDRLQDESKQIIFDLVMPAYASFLEFLNEEYIPNSRETIATSELPEGEAYYLHLIEYFTTLPMKAEEIHQIGLDEVGRIRGEMLEIIEEIEFEDTFDEFLDFLRTDPQFYVDDPVELLKEASWLAKRMDGKLLELFHKHTLPRAPYGVEAVPDHLAPRYTAGHYSGRQGTRAAHYWVNTVNLPSRPLYAMEALTYHEAVPGHHLQIGLHEEMDDLPRRLGGLTAYTEGWALYSERLGLEVDLYKNPYNNFGRLTYEMFRASRLVVDTGMHALGWTRQQAVEFMTENTALSHHEIDTEINRYIAWPGQALAYKMGELKITQLRELAEETLGDDFDIRDFHEAVLKNGPVTLPVLEQQVMAFINDKHNND